MNRFCAWIFLVIFCCFFGACQKKTIIKTDTGRIKVKTKERARVQKIDLSTISSKAKIEYTDGRDQYSATANIRIKKDSVIWISVTALGIEAIRCLIRQDSVFLVYKLKKEYMAYSIPEMGKKMNFDLSFDMIQSIMMGNMPYDQIEEDSIRKDSVFQFIFQQRKNLNLENIIKTESSNLEQLTMKDAQTGNNMDINYNNFAPLDAFIFPNSQKISFKYRDKNEYVNTYISIEHKKIDATAKDLKFPFSIPNKYERR